MTGDPAVAVVSTDAAPVPRQRWWGWGQDGHDSPLGDGIATLLAEELGDPGDRVDPVALNAVVLPPSDLPGAAGDALVALVGPPFVTDDHGQRVSHAAGRSYPDLVRLRAGRLECAPDAVVFPADAVQVAAVLAVCVEHGIAVVPFGGGSSVVGGVDALRGDHNAAVCLDLTRLNALVDVDPVSQLATLGAGTYGPDAEALLSEHDLCLGHLPQSFEFSTVGGWVATRSSGQASTGYGRIDALVRGLRMATPSGEIAPLTLPGTAAGPDLRDLLVGSEGTLGVITEATVRVRPVPETRHSEAWAIDGFAAGVEAIRDLEQSGVAADVTRLADEEESRFNLAAGGTAASALSLYLRARGRSRPCVLILSFDGSADHVLERRRRAARVLHRHDALELGTRPGAAWESGRFHAPYLRDELMSCGYLVDTLETATAWSALLDLYRGVGGALRQSLTADGTPPLVGCHVSHLYPTGASLYFTFLARAQREDPIAQWRAAKGAAGEAIVAAGATITHHHAVGRDHAPWLGAEIGDLGLGVLRAAKAHLDPTGIMNPGKLMHG